MHRLLAACVAAAVLGGPRPAAGLQTSSPTSPLRITFFDVGQGDAALIVTPTGRHILVDAGPVGAHIDARLRRMRIDTLDLVVASHNHSDHVGGMTGVLESVVVKRYIDNGMPQATQTYRRIVSALERRGVEVLVPSPRTFAIGGGAELRVLPSSRAGKTQNDRSVGLLLSYGKFSALFTGDAEGLQRRYWMDSAGLQQVQVLKVAHHGSVNGTDARFLSLVRACAAIVSVGAVNGFGHPSARVLGLLGSSGIRVYRTDQVGDVNVFVDSTSNVRIVDRRGENRPCPLRSDTTSRVHR